MKRQDEVQICRGRREAKEPDTQCVCEREGTVVLKVGECCTGTEDGTGRQK